MSFVSAVAESIETEFNRLLDERRDAVRRELVRIFNEVPKTPSDNLEERVLAFHRDIDEMVSGLVFQFNEGEVVVKASGRGELTLRLLKAGGQWFGAVPNINDIIMRTLSA